MDWVQKLGGSRPFQVFNKQEIESVISSSYIAALGFFQDLTSPAAKAFQAAASGHKHYMAAYTSDAASLELVCEWVVLLTWAVPLLSGALHRLTLGTGVTNVWVSSSAGG